MCYIESLLTSFLFSRALRVVAVVAALYGSVSLPAREHQAPQSGQPAKPVPAEPQSAPGATAEPEQSPEDAAKPTEDVAPHDSPSAPAAPEEEAKAASDQVPAQFFHGTVTHFSTEFVTVSRSLVGKRPESRRFLILRTTKMRRGLHLRAKVTVRYKHLPEGDVALEIQIHPAVQQKS